MSGDKVQLDPRITSLLYTVTFLKRVIWMLKVWVKLHKEPVHQRLCCDTNCNVDDTTHSQTSYVNLHQGVSLLSTTFMLLIVNLLYLLHCFSTGGLSSLKIYFKACLIINIVLCRKQKRLKNTDYLNHYGSKTYIYVLKELLFGSLFEMHLIFLEYFQELLQKMPKHNSDLLTSHFVCVVH